MNLFTSIVSILSRRGLIDLPEAQDLVRRSHDLLYRGLNSVLLPDFLTEQRFLNTYFGNLVRSGNTTNLLNRLFEYAPNRYEPADWLILEAIRAVSYVGEFDRLADIWRLCHVTARSRSGNVPPKLLEEISNIPESFADDGVFERLFHIADEILEHSKASRSTSTTSDMVLHATYVAVLAKKKKKVREFMNLLQAGATRSAIPFDLSNQKFQWFGRLVTVMMDDGYKTEAENLLVLARKSVANRDWDDLARYLPAPEEANIIEDK